MAMVRVPLGAGLPSATVCSELAVTVKVCGRPDCALPRRARVLRVRVRRALVEKVWRAIADGRAGCLDRLAMVGEGVSSWTTRMREAPVKGD